MWIYEKFYSWTDNNGSPEDALVAGPDAGRHFTLLVYKHRGIVGTDLLGE